MLGFFKDGTAVALILFHALMHGAAADEEVVFTDHFLVHLNEMTDEDAHQLALEHGFRSARKVSSKDRVFAYACIQVIMRFESYMSSNAFEYNMSLFTCKINAKI